MTSFVDLLRDEFRLERFGFGDCRRKQFLQFQWSSNRVYFLLYRAFSFLYVMGWLITDVVINEDPFYITYLTHWGEIIMFLYFASSFVIATWSSSELNAPVDSNEQPTGHAPLRWYHVITWGMLNIYVTVAVVITISYWVGVGEDLIEPTKSHPSVNVHVHVINFVLAVAEVTLNNLPIRILHVYWPIIFGFVYVIFTLIVHWSGGPSDIYAVVNWLERPGMAAGVVFGLLFVAVPVFHAIVPFPLFKTRIYFYNKYFSNPTTKPTPPQISLAPFPTNDIPVNTVNHIALNLTEELTRL